MNYLRRGYLASLVALSGGAVQIIYGLLAIRFHFWENGNEWMEALWVVANVGMIGGALGLLFLDVGRPRWLAVIGAVISVLGNLIRIVASTLILAGAGADVYTPVLVSSIPLMMLGMGALGVATLLGKQLAGWRAWTPLLAVGFAILTASTYSVNLYLHGILLGLWGILCMLVGYVVFTHAANPHQAMLGQASSAGPEQGVRLTQHH
jgi:hypothetical protein